MAAKRTHEIKAHILSNGDVGIRFVQGGATIKGEVTLSPAEFDAFVGDVQDKLEVFADEAQAKSLRAKGGSPSSAAGVDEDARAKEIAESNAKYAAMNPGGATGGIPPAEFARLKAEVADPRGEPPVTIILPPTPESNAQAAAIPPAPAGESADSSPTNTPEGAPSGPATTSEVKGAAPVVTPPAPSAPKLAEKTFGPGPKALPKGKK